MDAHALLGFAAVLGVACAAPGPTTAALVARVLGRGRAGAPAFCAGLLLSDILWLSAAVLGLAVLAETMQPVFAAVRWTGAAYLLWLAWKLWTAPATPLAVEDAPRGEGLRLLLAGIAVGSGNPKTMLFYLALLPTLLPLDAVTPADHLALVATQCVVYGAVLAAYVTAAARARRALASPRTMRWINRGTAGVMAGAAVAVATRR
ncbi:MAG: LysE family translocator [Alphaproteobacteria bacterium]